MRLYTHHLLPRQEKITIPTEKIDQNEIPREFSLLRILAGCSLRTSFGPTKIRYAQALDIIIN